MGTMAREDTRASPKGLLKITKGFVIYFRGNAVLGRGR